MADSAEQLTRNKSIDRHSAAAIAQSVALQLYQAWHWHLQDIASHYKIQQPTSVTSVKILLSLLHAEGKSPVEAVELQNLISDNNSWASELFRAHAHLYRMPECRKAQMDADRLPVLALDSCNTEGCVDWTLHNAVNWLAKLQELIERHRDMMFEF